MSSSAALLLRLFFHLAIAFSAASEVTRFHFPGFSAQDNILAFGDAAYNPENRAYIINPGATTQSTGTCGELLYGNNVRIQDLATGRVASFSTSFSFAFTTHGLVWDNSSNSRDGSGFAFVFLPSTIVAAVQVFVSHMGRSGGCKSPRSENLDVVNPGLAVYFDTDYSPNHNEPSNNFVRISKNLPHEYDIPAYTHNLCGNDTHCSYFSTGKIFTVWIDFSSVSQTLEVRLANGSTPDVRKPLQPLLRIPNYKMSAELTDNVYLSFWGSSDVNHVETHELLSWSFDSSGVTPPIPSSQVLRHFSKGRQRTGFAIAVVGTVAVFGFLWYISWFAWPSRHPRSAATGVPREFTFKELRRATANFHERNLLGSGGSGSVYKGSLEGGCLVAVKQISASDSKHAESAFRAEVSTLSQIRHRNVVQLHGWSQEKGQLLLVYDYMVNGSLHEWLHNCCEHEPLSLHLRHSILAGVGEALEYLHEDCQRVVLHRDIKSSNVLLDAGFIAHLGDFGLARLIDHQKRDKTTLPAGTLGYMAPEMPYTGKATKESDVYSFGILMLEVVSGRRPLDMQAVEPEDLVLLYTVWRAHEARSLLDVADPRLLETFQRPSDSMPHYDVPTYEFATQTLPTSLDSRDTSNEPESAFANAEVRKAIVVNLLQLGLLCCLPNPKARPPMRQVNRILQQIRDMENASRVTFIAMPSLPATKPFGLYRSLEFSQTALSCTSGPSPVSSPEGPIS